MFNTIFNSIPFSVVFASCRQEEKDIVISSLKLQGAKIVYRDPGFAFRYPEKGEVLIIHEFTRDALEELNRYSVAMTVIGRLSQDEKHILYSSGYLSFWNLDNYNIELILTGMFKQVQSKIAITSIIWTGDRLLNRKLKSIFQMFSMQEVIAENTELALFALQEKHFDFMILDWDATGMETIRLIREFKDIRVKKNYFPRLLGIKDFEKPFVFQDLNLGIKDFSPVLFSKKEVLEILVNSFPIIFEEVSPVKAEETPIMKWVTGKDYQRLVLEYPDDGKIKKQNPLLKQTDYELYIFKKQFEWIKAFHDK